MHYRLSNCGILLMLLASAAFALNLEEADADTFPCGGDQELTIYCSIGNEGGNVSLEAGDDTDSSEIQKAEDGIKSNPDILVIACIGVISLIVFGIIRRKKNLNNFDV